ncbi:MAG: T9SS type A sorting domain-containing protein [Bacteroidales bacterium]|nr:T9SS type A sorting domain-containing protein [Bacteroidales bacterium]
MRKILVILGALITCASAFSQEVITELQTNSVMLRSKPVIDASLLKNARSTVEAPVTLPFLDDFSDRDIFPSSERWQDRFAFINTDYPVNPPNLGVATLDAINDKGEIYPDAVPGPAVFQADALTSRLIRLDSVFSPVARKITTADSIYLSFYYQPQGRGNAPELTDLLELDFGVYTGDSVFVRVDSTIYTIDKNYYPGDSLLLPCSLPGDPVWISVNPYLILHGGQYSLIPGDQSTLPCDSVFEPEVDWDIIWAATGQKLDTNFYVKDNPLSYFRRVMIPVVNEKWLRSDFRFRFRNYVSLADNSLPSWQSNADHWNIDLVYLNINRTVHDTTFKILSFVDRPPSMIKQYESMPYSQYMSDPTNMMKDSIEMVITNLDTLIHNTSYRYVLYDQNLIPLDTCLRGNWDISPVYQSGYLDYLDFAKPPVCFGFFPVEYKKDSAIFRIAHYLTTGSGSYEGLNDTLWATQFFGNYFAYDDGTAEAGYGLTPEGSQLAYRFTLKEPDTLRAIQMYFNETRTGANQEQFYLGVWKDDNGVPGERKYLQEVKKPVFTKTINQFHTYVLDTAIAIASTFYIGWIQTTDDNLNIGFDRHNQSQQYLFYNTTGEWTQSIQNGAVMMRPVVGKSLTEKEPAPAEQNQKYLVVYPNPAQTGTIHLRLPVELNDLALFDHLTLQVLNLTGQLVFEGSYSSELNIDPLSEGMYFVILRGTNPAQYFTGKLMIIR